MSNYKTQRNTDFYRKKRIERSQHPYPTGPIIGPQQQKLIKYLDEHGQTAVEFADEVGLQAPSLTEWLRSSKPLPLSLLAAIGPLVLDTTKATSSYTPQTANSNQPPPKTAKAQASHLENEGAASTSYSSEVAPVTTTSTKPSAVVVPFPKHKGSFSTNKNTKNKASAGGSLDSDLVERVLAVPDTALLAEMETSVVPRGPTISPPANPNQLEMLRVLLRKKGETETQVIARLKIGRLPLERLLSSEARKLQAILINETRGKMSAEKAKKR